jgi:hypothetical protein
VASSKAAVEFLFDALILEISVVEVRKINKCMPLLDQEPSAQPPGVRVMTWQ